MGQDFLADLAAKTGAAGDGDKKKSSTPVVTVQDEGLGAAIDELSELLRDQKRVKNRIEKLKGDINGYALSHQRLLSKTDGKYHSTIRFKGCAGCTVNITRRGQYSKIPLSAKAKIIESLGEYEFIEDPESAFDERFSSRVTAKLDTDALQDPSNSGLLERLVKRHPQLRAMLDVAVHYEPKETWHKSTVFSVDEGDLLDSLIDQGLLSPYNATFR